MLGTWVSFMKLTTVRCGTDYGSLIHIATIMAYRQLQQQILFPDKNKPLDHKDNVTYLYRDLVYCEANCTLILYCWLFLHVIATTRV